MKCLYITNTYLHGRSGVVNASKAFINAFAALSNSFTLVCPSNNENAIEDINANNICVVPVADKRSSIVKFVQLLFGKIHRFSDETKKLFDKSKYDLVVFDASPVTFHLIKVAKQAGLKTITIHHNYQMEYVKDDTDTILKYPLLFWTYISERQAVINSDINLTLTQSDADSLKIHYCRSAVFEVVGVFEHSPQIKDVVVNSINKRHFVITGQLSSLQTKNSLLPWINNYYPIIRSVFPDSKLTIAGRNPSDDLIKVCKSNGIEIIPSPDNIDSIVKDADYYICPTSLGSGLKLRIMDGMKYGLSVLSHEKSARGYEEMMKKGILYSYSDEDSFKRNLNSMVSNSISKQTVIDIYYSWFSFEAGKERLKTILDKYI